MKKRHVITSVHARETAREFGDRIRGYWGVENKVHYVRDVTKRSQKSEVVTSGVKKTAKNFSCGYKPTYNKELYRDTQCEIQGVLISSPRRAAVGLLLTPDVTTSDFFMTDSSLEIPEEAKAISGE